MSSSIQSANLGEQFYCDSQQTSFTARVGREDSNVTAYFGDQLKIGEDTRGALITCMLISKKDGGEKQIIVVKGSLKEDWLKDNRNNDPMGKERAQELFGMREKPSFRNEDTCENTRRLMMQAVNHLS